MQKLSFSTANGHPTVISSPDLTESVEIHLDRDKLDQVYDRIIRVVVADSDGKEAIAFLSAKNTPRGVSFCLTTKVNDHLDETKRDALATFAEPVSKVS